MIWTSQPSQSYPVYNNDFYMDSLLSLDGSLALLKEVETPVSLMWWSASPLGNFLINSGDESCRQVCKSAPIYKVAELASEQSSP